ncbi:hypothetical protein [Rhizobium sp. RCC_161_2]|uniref:hypothetical protein n=1 Tax=Rhizobium sp. RCC_161_2 TaxID=3239219 RepID=UPI003523F173
MVRELKERLDCPLFERHHRSVVLTAVGEMLQAVLMRTFDEIDMALDEVHAHCDPAGDVTLFHRYPDNGICLRTQAVAPITTFHCAIARMR